MNWIYLHVDTFSFFLFVISAFVIFSFDIRFLLRIFVLRAPVSLTYSLLHFGRRLLEVTSLLGLLRHADLEALVIFFLWLLQLFILRALVSATSPLFLDFVLIQSSFSLDFFLSSTSSSFFHFKVHSLSKIIDVFSQVWWCDGGVLCGESS